MGKGEGMQHMLDRPAVSISVIIFERKMNQAYGPRGEPVENAPA